VEFGGGVRHNFGNGLEHLGSLAADLQPNFDELADLRDLADQIGDPEPPRRLEGNLVHHPINPDGRTIQRGRRFADVADILTELGELVCDALDAAVALLEPGGRWTERRAERSGLRQQDRAFLRLGERHRPDPRQHERRRDCDCETGRHRRLPAEPACVCVCGCEGACGCVCGGVRV